jgi:hypothetical protein
MTHLLHHGHRSIRCDETQRRGDAMNDRDPTTTDPSEHASKEG